VAWERIRPLLPDTDGRGAGPEGMPDRVLADKACWWDGCCRSPSGPGPLLPFRLPVATAETLAERRRPPSLPGARKLKAKVTVTQC
jgi:hypothetical protein